MNSGTNSNFTTSSCSLSFYSYPYREVLFQKKHVMFSRFNDQLWTNSKSPRILLKKKKASEIRKKMPKVLSRHFLNTLAESSLCHLVNQQDIPLMPPPVEQSSPGTGSRRHSISHLGKLAPVRSAQFLAVKSNPKWDMTHIFVEIADHHHQSGSPTSFIFYVPPFARYSMTLSYICDSNIFIILEPSKTHHCEFL